MAVIYTWGRFTRSLAESPGHSVGKLSLGYTLHWHIPVILLVIADGHAESVHMDLVPDAAAAAR